MSKTYEFDTKIIKKEGMDAAYIEFPYDVRKEFNKGRVLVHATFDGEPYDGQLVRMKTDNHIIGITKAIRAKINKQPGDTIHVTIKERPSQKTVQDIDSYIKQFDVPTQEKMILVRKTIHECHPNIKEKISWGMATFTLNGNLAHFAGHKNHLGFYVAPKTIADFKEQLSAYKTSKGAIQFPYNKEILMLE